MVEVSGLIGRRVIRRPNGNEGCLREDIAVILQWFQSTECGLYSLPLPPLVPVCMGGGAFCSQCLHIDHHECFLLIVIVHT